MEYGYTPDAADAILVLMRHLGETATGAEPSIPLKDGDGDTAALRNPADPRGPALLMSHTAHDPALEENLREAGAFVMHHPDNFYMWRVIAPHKLAGRLGVPADEAEAALFAMLRAANTLYWTADRF
jgi:hypothetical protein